MNEALAMILVAIVFAAAAIYKGIQRRRPQTVSTVRHISMSGPSKPAPTMQVPVGIMPHREARIIASFNPKTAKYRTRKGGWREAQIVRTTGKGTILLKKCGTVFERRLIA